MTRSALKRPLPLYGVRYDSLEATQAQMEFYESLSGVAVSGLKTSLSSSRSVSRWTTALSARDVDARNEPARGLGGRLAHGLGDGGARSLLRGTGQRPVEY